MNQNSSPTQNNSSTSTNQSKPWKSFRNTIGSVFGWIQKNPRDTFIIFSTLLNVALFPGALQQYLPWGKKIIFSNTILYCEGSHNPPSNSGVLSIDFNAIPKEARDIAEQYISQLGLCVRAAQQEQQDGSYEIFLADTVSDTILSTKVSPGESIIEMDIVKNAQGTYYVEEFEKTLTWNFVQTHESLNELEKKIIEKCLKPESSFIELSERNTKRRPGSVLRDPNVVYEFECISKSNNEYREYEVDFEWTIIKEKPLSIGID